MRTNPTEVKHGEKCPECGSTNTFISQFDKENGKPHCPWCNNCGYGWMNSS